MAAFKRRRKTNPVPFFGEVVWLYHLWCIYIVVKYISHSHTCIFFHMASSFFFLEFKVVIFINNKWSSWFWQLGYFICHVRKFVFTLAHLSKPTEQYEVNNHLLPYLQHWSSYQNEIWVDRCLARIAPYLVLCSSTCVDYW